jgi:hypothetical protein
MTCTPTHALALSELRPVLGDAVGVIAQTLATPSTIPRESSPGLGGGSATRALFFHHLARYSGDPTHRDLSAANAEQCAAALESVPLSAALYSGFTGIAWLLAHLQSGDDAAEHFDLSDIDGLLVEYVSRRPAHELHFDLISGLVGIGVYFLERLPSDGAVAGLRWVVARLASGAERGPDGVTWRTAPHFVPPHMQPMFPDGRYDLGVAHGSPGVIAFLAHACRCAAVAAEARALLKDAVRWLLARRFRAIPAYSFPGWYPPGGEAHALGTRAAWCYGDPGVGYALHLAAAALADPALEAIAMHMLASMTRRDRQAAGVIDASLCHGSAGLAHLAHVLWLETQEEALAAAAERWLGLTMGLRKPDRGVAGFEYFRGDEEGWQPDGTFLTGAGGIGLAALFALHPEDRSWDRLLLLS